MSFLKSLKKGIAVINDFQVRVLTSRTVRFLLPHIKQGERVLDIGSGLGFQARMVAEKTRNEVHGIDVVAYSKTDIPFKHFDGVYVPYNENEFDVSYLSFVLHHTEKPLELLQDAIRVTKKRIIIIEDTPRNCFDKAFDAYHGWSFNAFYGLKHKCVFYTKREWTNMFDSLNVKHVEAKRLSRFAREPYFPISRTVFVLHLS